MKRFNSLKRLFNGKSSQTEEDSNNVNENVKKEAATKTLLSIGENKNARSLTVTFHCDAFFANMLKLHDEPPLNTASQADDHEQYKEIALQLKQHSPKIIFTVTISNKLCELGYVRVNATEFMYQVHRFMPICLTLERHKIKRQYLYIPMTVELPALQQRPTLFADAIVPTLLVLPPSPPTLYRYKLTEAFLWRYQYVRIREFPSLKMEVIGEIPCDLHLEMIGYPVRAILPNFMNAENEEKESEDIGVDDNYHLIDTPLRQRSSATMTKMQQWSLLENAYWVKLVDSSLKTLPLMTECMDELEAFVKDRQQSEQLQNDANNNDSNESDENDDGIEEKNPDYFAQYFVDRGYVIQQYLGHTVLQKIGPLLGAEHRETGIPIAFDTHNNLFVDHTQHNHLEQFPSDLIAHIFSYCSFEFVRRVLCRVNRSFSQAAQLPSCYRTAIIPLLSDEQVLYKPRLNAMTRALNKCKQIDIYSLISHQEQQRVATATTATATATASDKEHAHAQHVGIGECLVETFHLEFVTDAALHSQLFNMLSFRNLRCLKLSQCNVIQAAVLLLPNSLEEIYLLNTIIGVKSWHNLQHLRCLIITKSVSLHSSNVLFLQNIADTLPPQQLQTICIWDGQESNKLVIKKLTDKHNETLSVFGIGGRICLYRPFSEIFIGDDATTFSQLQILTVSCLSTNEIVELLVGDFAHQLRVLELFCPFVLELDGNSADIYEWILGESTVKLFCSALSNLEVLMCQAFPHDMQQYMTDTGWTELRQRFEAAFNQYRPHRPAPIILFDLGIDLNKMPQWTQPNIGEYLLKQQQELELNFGQGI